MIARALGLDVGLSGVRAAVLDATGRLHGTARRSVEVAIRGGRAEHDPDAWVTAALAAGGEAVRAAGDPPPQAVGLAALGPAPILVDRDGRALTPALLFSLDVRAEAQRRRLAAVAPISPDHALPKLLWWQSEHPGVVGRAAAAVDVAGYLAGALCGTPVMDAITRAAYVHPAAVAPVALPDPVEPLALVGGLLARAAGALALPAGTPVVAGTLDSYADLAWAGVRRPPDGGLVLGSTLVLYQAVASQSAPAGLDASPHLGDGVLLGGSTSAAGSALAWAVRELAGGDAAVLAEAASLLPGAGGVLALSALAGEREPHGDPAGRGALLGLSLATRRVELVRALLDGVALTARELAARLRAVAPPPSPWRVTGGGVRHEAWLRAVCDALDAPLAVAPHAGEAAGAAALALRALDADPGVLEQRRVEPDPERARRLAALHPVHASLYGALRSAHHALQELAG